MNDITYKFYSTEKIISIPAAVSVIDASYGPNFYFEGEQHAFWEFVYVLSGKVGITADDCIYTLYAGEIIFHKPMEFHNIWSSDQTNIRVFIFSFEASGSGTKQLENCTLKLSTRAIDALFLIMETGKLAFHHENGIINGIKDEKKAQVYFNLMEIFLIEVGHEKNISALEDNNAKIFSEIIKVLNDNIYSKISVDAVAEQCYISTARLKKLFSKYTGMGVSTYHAKIKVKKAMELLEQDYSIMEVSEILSYSSQFYFSTVFKKETGLTPSEYKKAYSRLTHN